MVVGGRVRGGALGCVVGAGRVGRVVLAFEFSRENCFSYLQVDTRARSNTFETPETSWTLQVCASLVLLRHGLKNGGGWGGFGRISGQD